jgi:trehalose 6-phosphate phosphatase
VTPDNSRMDAPGSDTAAPRPGAPALTPGSALFLDIDGTLVRHEDHPDDVRIEPGLIALLERLGDAMAGAIALISGRSLAGIDALFAPARFGAAGQHGAERRSVDGTLHCHAGPADRLREPAARLRRLVAAQPGLLLEEKGATLALHYRNAPQASALAEREARAIVCELGDDFELQAGKFVFEVKPSGKDKGTAIAEFLAEPPFAGRAPVFVGDDLTDELGFALVNAVGGESVKVGAGPTRARWRLSSADEVRRWLAAFATGGTVDPRGSERA